MTQDRVRGSISATLSIMLATAASDGVWLLGGIVGCGALWWLCRRLEPHWVAKDGRAFTCKVQKFTDRQEAEGRWMEARVQLDGDQVRLVVRGIGVPVQPYQAYDLVGRADTPSTRHETYVIRREHSFVMRLPRTSRAVATLNEILASQP